MSVEVSHKTKGSQEYPKSNRSENRKSLNPSLFHHFSFLFIASLKLWRSRLSRVMYSTANCLLLMKVGSCVRVSLWVWVSEISDARLVVDSQWNPHRLTTNWILGRRKNERRKEGSGGVSEGSEGAVERNTVPSTAERWDHNQLSSFPGFDF